MKWVLLAVWINGWGAPMQATTIQVPGFASHELCVNAAKALTEALRGTTTVCLQTEYDK